MLPLIYKLQKYLNLISAKTSVDLFDYSYKSQKKILDSFRDPSSLTERSYFQYKCQMFGQSSFIKVIQNFSALIILVYYLIKPFEKFIPRDLNKSGNNAVFLRDGINIDVIPVSLQKQYGEISEYPIKGKIYLCNDDKKFIIKNLIKYWCSPFFSLKCLAKLARYSKIIHNCYPSAIITHNEYSFTCSFLTDYCHYYGVKHINIMHGEKLFNIRDSFVKYDSFYVWDQYYAKLLVDLRADKKQFKIDKPSSLELDVNKCNTCLFEYTYYLGNENKNELLNIRENLLKTKTALDKICIRYHPRYCDEKQINNIFKEFKIENPHETTLAVSLSKTKYVVSLYSTVLYQAYEIGKKIIIDDVTNREKYKKLKNLQYIMINRPHRLLSEFIND